MSGTTSLNPIFAATQNNDFNGLKNALFNPQNLPGLYDSNNNSLVAAVRNHSAFALGLLLKTLAQYQNTQHIKPDSAVTLFPSPIQTVRLETANTPLLIAAAVQTLLGELKKSKRIEPDGPLASMVQAMDKSELVSQKFKDALNQTAASRMSSYGHTDASSVRESALTFRDAEEFIQANTANNDGIISNG